MLNIKEAQLMSETQDAIQSAYIKIKIIGVGGGGNNILRRLANDGFDKSQPITFTKENILLQNKLIITNEKLALEAIDFYHNNQLFLIAYQKLMNGFIF